MDEDSPPKTQPQDKPSPIPSWVSLGFVMGALVVLALPRRPSSSPAQPQSVLPSVSIQSTAPIRPLAPPPLSTIEAVFADWGDHAIWSKDVTEVALWDTRTKEFTECYEVVRVAGAYYFRSIPHLTRPVLTHGVQENSPLQFTETEEQRQEWLNDARKQSWKDFSEGARQSFGPPAITPPRAEPAAPPPVPINPSDEKPRDR